jgi:hypothetical protein
MISDASAIKNQVKAGVNEKVAVKISGHKTRAVFDRYYIVETEDVMDAMRRVQGNAPDSLVSNGENIVKTQSARRRRRQLTA